MKFKDGKNTKNNFLYNLFSKKSHYTLWRFVHSLAMTKCGNLCDDTSLRARRAQQSSATKHCSLQPSPASRHAEHVSASYKVGKLKISHDASQTLKQVQSDRYKAAFSLVEILVALIIVSLITAALAPVITKKLSSAGITIVGGGSGGSNTTMRREIDCDDENLMQIGDLCITRKNMGDSAVLTIPSTVNKVNVGTNCSSSNSCCWQGVTASSCNSDNGGYSGCSRTVCNYGAAENICTSFNHGGKLWRLPTTAELETFFANSQGLGTKGLQLCDNYSGNSHAQCSPATGSCLGARYNTCYPYALWSNISSGSEKIVYELLNAASWQSHTNPLNGAIGVRCVTENKMIEVPIGEQQTNSCTGKYCNDGFYPDPNADCACEQCTMPFCKLCNNDICTRCFDGYKLDGGRCVGGTEECNEVSDTHAAGEPSEACCASVGAVYLAKSITGLSKDLCMMKYNPYDQDGFNLNAAANNVKLVAINTICPLDGICCWKGNSQTSKVCSTGNNGDSTYSGCNRTMCQWNAAYNICSNYQPIESLAPGAWRLPTAIELSGIAKGIGAYSTSRGASGLQFCDAENVAGIDQCSRLDGNHANGLGEGKGCRNQSTDNDPYDDCYAYRIWGEGFSYLQLVSGSGTVASESDAKAAPKSVRCVTDNVNKGKATVHFVDTSIGEPASQADCDRYDALFIPAQYNGNAKGRNICITKYNFFDSTKITFNDEGSAAKLGVYFNNIDNICDRQSCCWTGGGSQTAKSCTASGNYPGCKRTVCQHTAAEILCKNWQPDGTQRGSWRLPTKSELDAMGKYITQETSYSYFLNAYLYDNGLNFCDNTTTVYGAYLCSYLDGNHEKGRGVGKGCIISGADADPYDNCKPYALWGDNYSFLELSDGAASVSVESSPLNYPKGVRCVTDSVNSTPYPDLTDDGISKENVAKYQQYCNKFNAVFIPSKFTGTEHLCMTRYNALDNFGPSYSDSALSALGVTKVAFNTVCGTGKCCWTGLTAPTNTATGNGNSQYVGGYRTICQNDPAKILCNNWAPTGTNVGDWRLPTGVELQNIARALNFETSLSYFLNRYMGANGLQFCDNTNPSIGMVRCARVDGNNTNAGLGGKGPIINTSDSDPYDNSAPYAIWGENKTYFSINGGEVSYGTETDQRANPKSVRCVSVAKLE